MSMNFTLKMFTSHFSYHELSNVSSLHVVASIYKKLGQQYFGRLTRPSVRL